MLGINNSLPFGVRHTQRLQCSARAAKSWFSRYVGLIHGGREATRVSKTFESFSPSSLMRGCEQDAINIENARGQRFGMVGLESSQFEDGHKLMPLGSENNGAEHRPARRSIIPSSGSAKIRSETTQPYLRTPTANARNGSRSTVICRDRCIHMSVHAVSRFARTKLHS